MSPGATNVGAVAQDLAQRRDVAGGDRRAAGQRLDRRQPEALVLGGEHQRVRAAVDARPARSSETWPVRVTSGSSWAHGRVGPTSTSGISRAAAASLATCLRRFGVLQAADPHAGSARAGRARAHGVDLLRASAGTSTASAASGITDDPLALEPQVGDRVVGDRLASARSRAPRAGPPAWRRRRRRPLRRCSLRRFSAAGRGA